GTGAPGRRASPGQTAGRPGTPPGRRAWGDRSKPLPPRRFRSRVNIVTQSGGREGTGSGICRSRPGGTLGSRLVADGDAGLRQEGAPAVGVDEAAQFAVE